MNKKYSLKQTHLFEKTLNKGTKIRNKHILVSFIKQEEFKIGISVPKKLGNAVFRNYNKRVVKDIVHKLNVCGTTSANIIFIIRESFIELSYDEKTEIIKDIFNKVNEATK